MARYLSIFLLINGLTLWSCEDQNLPYSCNEMYDPVCGSNEITYANDCHAEKAGVTDWTLGEC